MRTRERVTLWIAIGLCVGTLLAMLWRVERGVDFTDDSFYVSLPLRFSLGDRPFADELNVAQTAGLLLYPFVKPFVMLRGTTGIFVFIRVLFLLFFIGVGRVVFAVARTQLPRHAALVASAISITFLPHGIPGLSYNTLGSGLLTIGLFLSAKALIDPPDAVPRFHRDGFTWAGLALASASFAYPTLTLCAVVAIVTTFALAGGRRVVATVRMAVGGAVFALAVLPIFVSAGREHLREMLAYSAAGLVSNDGKIKWLLDESFGHHREWPALGVVTAVAVVLAKRWPRLSVSALPLLPLLALGATVKSTHVSIAFVTSLALFAPLVALALRDGRAARVLIAGVWLPSLSAGLVMSWTSSNGFIAAGSGLFPAALVSTIVIAKWIDEEARTFGRSGVRAAFGFAPVVVLFTLVRLALAPDSIYRDGAIPELTARMTSGPWAGILTTRDRKQWLEEISRDITARSTTSRALFYYDFPAGYLIAQKKPLVGTSWIFFREPATTIDAATFDRRAAPGDVVFRIGAFEEMNPAGNALDRAVQARGVRTTAATVGYTVWLVR